MTLTPTGYRPRVIDAELARCLKLFGAVEIRGPKWCGKTWAGLNQSVDEVYIAEDARLDDEPADALDGVQFELDDDVSVMAVESPREEAASDAAQQMLAEAMASGFGLVEKIDFDKLTFETDDE